MHSSEPAGSTGRTRVDATGTPRQEWRVPLKLTRRRLDSRGVVPTPGRGGTNS
ncbi:MAG TPA: hypothetical protein VG936_15080 [Lacunisphaera sp.]|nr:hypothetical protein [Lacunisphaera sp.]